MVVTKGEGGWERANWVKGVKNMVVEGKYTFDDKHTGKYTDINL